MTSRLTKEQELVTKEIEQKVKLKLENEILQEKLNAFEAPEVEETKAPSSLSMKLNVISGRGSVWCHKEQKTIENLGSGTPGSQKCE